jgi:AcrR family transcriptional regulator
MAANQTRTESKARTRVALATAAARLFRERGYEATTVEDIASAAGSSPSTFFRYFGTKEDVLFLNVREIMDDFREFMSRPIPGLEGWQQVKAGMHIAVRRVAEPSLEVREVSLMSWLNEPAIAGRFTQFSREMEEIIASALAAARGTSPDRDLAVQFAARSATAVYSSAFHIHLHTGRDVSDVLEEAFSLLESGLQRALAGGIET